MTVAPRTIKELASLWVDHGGRSLGIVGDTKHKQRGTSYHLGRSDLLEGAYSASLRRDCKGLSERASALDLGKLHGRIGKLRKFSNWLVDQAQDGRTPDIREIIWSPDGIEVHRWDDHQDRVFVSLRRHNGTVLVVTEGQGDASHYRHTHISFYRDSRLRPKVQYFQPFFDKPIPDHKKDEELEPDPTDELDLDPDDEDDPKPVDGHEPLFVRVKPAPHPRSTLSGIAREFDTTVKRILAFPENKEFRDKPGLVFAGQGVRVR